MKNLSVFALVALLFSLNACQKESINPISGDVTASTTTTQNLKNETIDVSAITIPERASATTLTTRADLSDIKDVIPANSEIIIACVGTPKVCTETRLGIRRANTIKPGERIGVSSAVSLSSAPASNRKEIYSRSTDAGVMAYGTYKGKDNHHPLNITADGDYRIQMTPINTNRNLDMFIYKLEVRDNGSIDSTLVEIGRLPSGKTETVHLRKKGFYTIIIDEELASNTGAAYMLAVSPAMNTNTKVTLSNNNLIYDFDVIVGISIENLSGWTFKRKVNSDWVDLGTFAATSTFVFLNAPNSDYLVAPVFTNNVTGTTRTAAFTMIRP
jgi:hypothetical protein